MIVGKINFTSIDANSRLQQKQQDRNIAFTGTIKPDISKSLLSGTVQTAEKGVGTQENNLWCKAIKYIKNLFKKDKQVTTGGETKAPGAIKTQKSLELGVPQEVTWTDFASIEGELIRKGIKVIKNEDGEIVKEFYSRNGKTVESVTDYDPITEHLLKETQFDDDGKTVWRVTDYDPITQYVIKDIEFNKDGTLNEVSDSCPKTGNLVKWTRFNKDTKTVKSVSEFDPITETEVKLTKFNKDGKTVSDVTEYDPITGKQVRWISFKKDGKTVDAILDYDPITETEVKLTQFNEDGTIKKVIDF